MVPAVIGAFFLLALLGMPLALSLGLASVGGLWVGDLSLSVLPQRMMHAVNSFPLMAIPFFMLAGELMIRGGIMERLIEFANSIVGRVRGGLAHVTVLSSMGLSSVSGAAVADASALSATLVPAMRRSYDVGYGSAVVAASSNLGPIIPPSAAMIVYALMAGSSVSVGALFMAGVVPGLIMTVAMMITCTVLAKLRGYSLTGEAFSLREVARQTKRSFIVFMMPVIVIGGIVGGVFTATEGAAIAVVYAALIGFFVTRRLSLADLPPALFRAAITASIVGALIAFASALTFLFTVELVPMRLASAIQAFTADPTVFLLLVMAMLLVVGMFLESNAAYIMLVPLFAPIALEYGLDPIYFGFLFVLNLVVAMLTPPVGVLLFVVGGVSRLSIGEMVRNVWPFILVQYAVLALCFFFPPIVTTLPRLLGY
ncbi:TRAP transporter large permease [Arhodomonas sp. AD133]|uniref:TRAP transporter large permease n=1 Tax=Arhodomonas sp. AD133 TaxID=3415009 RepID=UPI003EBD31EE